jgi:hypothetical protein
MIFEFLSSSKHFIINVSYGRIAVSFTAYSTNITDYRILLDITEFALA